MLAYCGYCRAAQASRLRGSIGKTRRDLISRQIDGWLHESCDRNPQEALFQCFWMLIFVLAPQSQNDILLPFSVRARSEKSPFLDFSSSEEFNGSDGSVAV